MLLELYFLIIFREGIVLAQCPTDYEVRLNSSEAVVEVCYDDQWTILCNSSYKWNAQTATVVCRESGYDGVGSKLCTILKWLFNVM